MATSNILKKHCSVSAFQKGEPALLTRKSRSAFGVMAGWFQGLSRRYKTEWKRHKADCQCPARQSIVETRIPCEWFRR
jgi:hypothetical protein